MRGMRAKDYPPRKSQTISPYKLLPPDTVVTLNGEPLNEIEDICFTSDSPRVHRLPRVHPLTDEELNEGADRSVVDHYSAHSNDVVLVLGDRSKATRRRDRHRTSQSNLFSQHATPSSQRNSCIENGEEYESQNNSTGLISKLKSSPEPSRRSNEKSVRISYSPSNEDSDIDSRHFSPMEGRPSPISIFHDNQRYSSGSQDLINRRSSSNSPSIQLDPIKIVYDQELGNPKLRESRSRHSRRRSPIPRPLSTVEDQYISRHEDSHMGYDLNDRQSVQLRSRQNSPWQKYRSVGFDPDDNGEQIRVKHRSPVRSIFTKPFGRLGERARSETRASGYVDQINHARDLDLKLPTPAMMEGRFVDRSRKLHLDESRVALLKAGQLGELAGYVSNLELHLRECDAIPGGPLVAVVYLSVLQPVILRRLLLSLEESSRFESLKGKNHYENRNVINFTCLTSDPSIDRREPPHRFTHNLPEFLQPLDAPVKPNTLCYLPYFAPVLFRQGRYAIPCIITIDPTTHPSFVLSQFANTPQHMELTHSFQLEATLYLKKEDDRRAIAVQTEKLPVRILSCGPMPRSLANGQPIPSVSRTIVTPFACLLLQIDSLIVTDGDTVNMFVLTDKPEYVRSVEVFLLQVFHIPSMDIDDQKSLQKARKFPANVNVLQQASSNRMVHLDHLPFSQAAETSQDRRVSGTSQLPSVYITSEEEHLRSGNISSEVSNDLPRADRRGGCHLSVTVPAGSIPTLCMDIVRVTYYIRLLIQVKRRVTACTVPLTVVSTQCQDYEIRYLSSLSYHRDRAEIKRAKSGRCAVS